MKWVALVIVLAGIRPLAARLRRSHNTRLKVLMLMGALPWVLDTFHLFMAIISWVDWPGYVKGFEFSLLDALALAVYLSLPRHGLRCHFRSMALYFVAALLSVLLARVPMAALFYAWQLARMYLVYAVVTTACAADLRAVRALMNGMVAGLFLEAADVVWERFGLGVLQAGGTTHQNLLGMMSHFVVFPFFALLLTGERGWLPAAGTLAGVIVQVLTTSRATLGLAGFAYAALFVLSAVRQWTSQKGRILLIGVAVAASLAPFIISSLEHRFAVENAIVGNYDERAAFERAAAMILSDYPLGVGANHYADVSITEGYSAKAGVAPTRGSMTAQVHNIYWLVVAETGYLGLATFVLFLLRPMTVAFACGWRHRKDRRGDLLLGLGMALLIVYIHSFFEWIFITFKVQYMFAFEVGMIAGLAQQLGHWQPSTGGYALSGRRLPARSRDLAIRTNKENTIEFQDNRLKL